MRIPSRETVEMLRKKYPVGTIVELRKMSDPQAPPVGTRGKIIGVDDVGSLMVRWRNGSGLNVVFGEDEVAIISAVCPRCGRNYSDPPALSRKDNKTPICPDCGIREALESIGTDESEQDKILDTIRRCHQP